MNATRKELSIAATRYFGVNAEVENDGEIWLRGQDGAGWTSEADRDAFHAWFANYTLDLGDEVDYVNDYDRLFRAIIIGIETNQELGVRYYRIRLLESGNEINVRGGEISPVLGENDELLPSML